MIFLLQKGKRRHAGLYLFKYKIYLWSKKSIGVPSRKWAGLFLSPLALSSSDLTRVFRLRDCMALR